MNPEKVINITSDKYHVTGTLEDYGVVIKLHFDYNSVSRTVGISRPLRESLAEKGLEMMEATIELLSDPGKVSLHYWYIDLHNEKLIAHGLVTGHPRVEDTTKIHTSPIQNISVDYDAEEVLVRTKNRVYHCPLNAEIRCANECGRTYQIYGTLDEAGQYSGSFKGNSAKI